jgi:hypothetical protein
MAVVKRYLSIKRDLHGLTRVTKIDLTGDTGASVELYATLANQPIGSAQSSKGIPANLLQFRFELAGDDGDLRVIPVHWQPAGHRQMWDQ